MQRFPRKQPFGNLSGTLISEHGDPEITMPRLPAYTHLSHSACVCVSLWRNRRQEGVFIGGEEADHGGGERGPQQAEPAGGLRGGGGGHVGFSSGADETSGDPGGRAGHTGEAPPPTLVWLFHIYTLSCSF